MKNIYLVQFPFFNYGIVLPYAAGCLQSYSQQHPEVMAHYLFKPLIWDSRVSFDEIVDSMDQPFLVGFSIYIWNKQRSLKLAKLIKEKYPQTHVVFGGPSVPNDAKKFMLENESIDFIIQKEGEIAFQKLLLSLTKPQLDLSQIGGLSYRLNKEVQSNTHQEIAMNPIDYPSPYTSGLFDHIINSEQKGANSIVATWETNRGCPYSCTFCDWGSYTNQRVRTISDERLKSEILWFGKNVDEIYVADANFGILARDKDFAQQLADQSRSKKPENRLHTVRVFYAKNSNKNVLEIAKQLNQVNLSRSGVSISLQTTDAHVLENIKRSNIKLERLYELQEMFKKENIPTLTELILGLPGQTKESFINSMEQSLEADFSDINVFNLIRIENAQMFLNTSACEQFKYKTQVLIKGKTSDENELVDYVEETNLISKSVMSELFSLAEMIDILHLRKWTYFIAWYFKKRYQMPLVRFYEKLIEAFKNEPNSIIAKLHQDKFILNLNNGQRDAFVGERSPGDIEWEGCFFDSKIFNWVCIHELKDQFYMEITHYLKSLESDNEVLHDLLSFQKNIMLDSSYCPKSGKALNMTNDWPSFFESKSLNIPEKKKVSLHLNTQYVGRAREPISQGTPNSLYNFAGGFKQVMDKSNSFVHNSWTRSE